MNLKSKASLLASVIAIASFAFTAQAGATDIDLGITGEPSSPTLGGTTFSTLALADHHTPASIGGAHMNTELAPKTQQHKFGSADLVTAPKVETWAIILLGVGLVAHQIRRKQKALKQLAVN